MNSNWQSSSLETSCGTEILRENNRIDIPWWKRMWFARGEVMERFNNEVMPEIEALLQTEDPGYAEYYFSVVMVGVRQTTARPKIIVSCPNRSVRNEVLKIIKDSHIPKTYPGFRYGATGVPLHEPVPSEALDGEAETAITVWNDHMSPSPASLPSHHSSRKPGVTSVSSSDCDPLIGRKVFVSNTCNDSARFSTGGIVLRIGKEYYQKTVGHVDEPLRTSVQDWPQEDIDYCQFDDDSDDEDNDLFELDCDITSRGSLTPPADSLSVAASYDDETETGSVNTIGSPSNQDEARQCSMAKCDDTRGAIQLPQALYNSLRDCPQPEYIGQLQYNSRAGSKPGLDYALVLLGTPCDTNKSNRICLDSVTNTSIQVRDAEAIPAEERDVVTVTASGGITRGKIRPSAVYVRVPNQTSLQKLFVVQLDTVVIDGDCGADVVDENTGALYGHIVRGCRGTQIAYIVSALEVLADLRERLDANPVVVSPGLEEAETTWSGLLSDDQQAVDTPETCTGPLAEYVALSHIWSNQWPVSRIFGHEGGTGPHKAIWKDLLLQSKSSRGWLKDDTDSTPNNTSRLHANTNIDAQQIRKWPNRYVEGKPPGATRKSKMQSSNDRKGQGAEESSLDTIVSSIQSVEYRDGTLIFVIDGLDECIQADRIMTRHTLPKYGIIRSLPIRHQESAAMTLRPSTAITDFSITARIALQATMLITSLAAPSRIFSDIEPLDFLIPIWAAHAQSDVRQITSRPKPWPEQQRYRDNKSPVRSSPVAFSEEPGANCLVGDDAPGSGRLPHMQANQRQLGGLQSTIKNVIINTPMLGDIAHKHDLLLMIMALLGSNQMDGDLDEIMETMENTIAEKCDGLMRYEFAGDRLCPNPTWLKLAWGNEDIDRVGELRGANEGAMGINHSDRGSLLKALLGILCSAPDWAVLLERVDTRIPASTVQNGLVSRRGSGTNKIFWFRQIDLVPGFSGPTAFQHNRSWPQMANRFFYIATESLDRKMKSIISNEQSTLVVLQSKSHYHMCINPTFNEIPNPLQIANGDLEQALRLFLVCQALKGSECFEVLQLQLRGSSILMGAGLESMAIPMGIDVRTRGISLIVVISPIDDIGENVITSEPILLSLKTQKEASIHLHIASPRL
ncbi:hypothetical protein BJ166DRAFT_601554 [Pestalotiopsis sp. NC0098]|nr:hypothetical protein BJ166DRAFT_601554 [Pestalotiopsis sp. NC0098]